MTQPQQSHTGQIVATTAIGLALVAIEARVREEVQDDTEAAFAIVTAALLLAIASGAALTGLELLSLDTVHKTLTAAFRTAKGKSAASVEAGYAAAAQLALTRAQRDMTAIGHEVPSTLPDLGGTIEAISRDVDLAYDQTLNELRDTIAEAYDSHTSDERPDAIRDATDTTQARLDQRLQAAAATAVHQGSSDAQNAIFAQYTDTNPYVRVRKRWRVTAADPCAICLALDGTEVDVRAEFNHDAGRDHKDYRPVWRNLQGPPRHPNCRCQLELVTT